MDKSCYYKEASMQYLSETDEELDKVINGDKDAFINIIEQNKIDLYKMGRSMLDCEEDIGDAMQETIIKAFKNIKSLKSKDSFKSWLLKIMVNECYNIRNKNKMYFPTDDVNIEVIHNDSYEVENQHVLKAIKTLDEEFKEPVILYYYNDLSVKDISKTLQISEGTVKSRLSRARKKLYNLLKGEIE